MRAFLDDAPFLFTGSSRWNALGLGTTGVLAMPLVYNTKRSGTFLLDGRPFILRRVAFPRDASPEWFVIDLIEHADQIGGSRQDICAALSRAVARRQFKRDRLQLMANEYGTKQTQAEIATALRGATS